MSTQYKKATPSWARVGCRLDQKQFPSTQKTTITLVTSLFISAVQAFS
jgi:hypothetical protein